MKKAWQCVLRFSLAWVCSFVYLLAIYFPAASIPFAHHDQYRYFITCGQDTAARKLIRNSDSQWNWLRLIGRPVAAELEHQVFIRANTVDDLVGIRIFAIGLFATAMAMLLCYLLELRLTASSAFCLAGAVFALPAVQFSVHMASLNHPVAHILALTSALLMRLGSRLSAGKERWYLDLRRIACHVLSITLLVVALLSYPPSAFVVMFLIGAEIALKGAADWPATRGHLIRDAFLLAVACVVYYLIIKRHYVLSGGHPHLGYQIEMNLALSHRLRCFAEQWLWPTLNLWNVHVSGLLGDAVACFLISGLGVMFFRQPWQAWRNLLRMAHAGADACMMRVSAQCTRLSQRLSRGLQLVAAIGVVLALSETTYFAAPGSWTLYRTHFASAGITVLLLAGTAICWSRVLAPQWRSKAAAVLAWSTLCGAGLVANSNVLMNCLNARLELSFIGAQIAAHAGEPIRRIHVIQPANERFTFNGCECLRSGDEFNFPTTGQHVSIGNAVRAGLQAVFERDSLRVCDTLHTIEALRTADPQAIAITYSAHGQPVVSSPHMIVIDMNSLLRLVTPTKQPWHAAPPLATASAAGPSVSR